MLEKRVDALEHRVDTLEGMFKEILVLQEATHGVVSLILKEHRADMDRINQRFEAQDKRFEAQDKRFEAQDKRFEAQDKRFGDQDKRFDKIEETLVQIVGLLFK